MGSAGEGLSTREAILLALDAAGGKVEGRTAIQKVMYFIATALEDDLGHQAHYYGPYSRPVEYTLTQEGLAEDLEETVERFPSWYGSGPDIRKYTYELTEQGQNEAAEIKEQREREADVISRTVAAVKEAVPDLDQQALSMAAKIHFIVTQADREKTRVSELPKLAEELGWRLTNPQVDQAVELLKKLDLVSLA